MPNGSQRKRRNTRWNRGLSALALRSFVSILGLVLAWHAWSQFKAAGAAREATVAEAEAAGTLGRHPELKERILRELDPAWSQLRFARAMLADEIAPSWQAQLSRRELETELERGFRRLARVREIARETFIRRPASWQSPMLLAGAIYIDKLRHRDPSLTAPSNAWSDALRVARDLGPGQPEPLLLSAATMLDNWGRLNELQRKDGRALLAEAFIDPGNFQLLYQSWLGVAPTPEVAFEPMPNDPEAWRQVEFYYARQADWSAALEAEDRRQRAELADLEKTLETARQHVSAGDVLYARGQYGIVISKAPTDARYLPVFKAALSELPAGPVGRQLSESAHDWLRWCLRRTRWREPDLDGEELVRLAALAHAEPALRAQAAILADDRAGAEQLEADAQTTDSGDWSDYYLLKAKWLLEHGDTAAAGAALDRTATRSRSSLVYWQARLRWAKAAGEPAARGEAEARLEIAQRQAWLPTDWRWSSGTAHLVLSMSKSAEGVEIGFLRNPEKGYVIGIGWDGGPLEARLVPPGASSVSVDRALDAGVHELAFDNLLGGRLQPGAVRLVTK